MRRHILLAAFLLACAGPMPARDSDVPSGALVSTAVGLGAPRACSARESAYFAGTPLAEREDWYGKHLRAAGEAPLCPGASAEQYRFLWLRSFHRPVVVRIEVSAAGSAMLVAKELDGAGGYEPGRVARDTSFALAPERWAEMRRLLDDGFWRMPTAPADTVFGLDGAQWVLEGTATGQYHVVDRWTPEHSPGAAPYRAACLALLRVSGFLPTSSEDVY